MPFERHVFFSLLVVAWSQRPAEEAELPFVLGPACGADHPCPGHAEDDARSVLRGAVA